MKKVILLFVMLPYLASGQVCDNFESGLSVSWEQSPSGRWSADTIKALSGRYSLHHSFDNHEAGTDIIAIPLKDIHPDEGVSTWSFTIRHGYDPSSSNNWSVFLFSGKGPSQMSGDADAQGFAIGVNLTGYDDTLRLWKVAGGLYEVVVNCRINWQTDVGTADPVYIRVERYPDGTWNVTLSRMDATLISQSSGNEPYLYNPSWFGIYYRYTSTRDRLLWIDDINISGVFYADTVPPRVLNSTVCGKRSVVITLNEEADSSFTGIENFYLNSEENIPLSVTRLHDLAYLIEFADEFINKTLNTLTINRLSDVKDNFSLNLKIEFTPVWAERGDIIISEIMADPLPSVSLPEKEYIEITNRTSFPYDLHNWKLISGEQKTTLPHITIGPSEIIILCSLQDTAILSGFGMTKGIKSFPTLNDDGKLLCLTDTSGVLIHGVEYSNRWYGNELKSKGGWSLEMIDTSYPFYYEGNWSASVSRKGGSPGSVNSVARVNRDVSFSGIINVFPDDSSSIICSFSEPVEDIGRMKDCIIKGAIEIIDVQAIDPLQRKFGMKLSSSLNRGIRYKIEFPDEITDFAGNKMERYEFEFGLAETPVAGDILFNELLFNPLPGDPDFIELFNCSEKVIDASRLHLVYVNDATSDTSVMVPVSPDKRCIMPGAYYAITSGRQRIIERYFSALAENLFGVSSLPSMPDAGGILILFSSELDVIDRVSYSEKMHYSLLSGYEGISLEKTGTCSLSGESVNWHSAMESSGWATPGGPNSVFIEALSHTESVTFSSTRMTPDGDGYEDFLSISMALKGYDNVVSVSVFDESGAYVRKVAANVLAGAEATFIWNGTADDGTPVNSGIYIILINLFDDKGKTQQWKRVCTVLR